MATLTFVFDPYCPRSAATAREVVELAREVAPRVRVEAVHAGTWSARLGLGPDSERSARLFCALRAAAPQQALRIAHELHQALGARGERLGRGVLTGIAHRVGIEPAHALSELRRPKQRDHARAELQRGRSLLLGVAPTLLFEHDSILTSVPLDSGPLHAALQPMLPPAQPRSASATALVT